MKSALKLSLAVAAAMAIAQASQAAIITTKIDVTVVSNPGSAFSAPFFTYTNLSDSGINISTVRMSGGAPWDWVNKNTIIDPAGGSRTLTEGEERTTDGNNGCTVGITYNYSSFNPGDHAVFAADPEAPGCGSAVVDVRPYLDANTTNNIRIDAWFSNGVQLGGNAWALELIDPNGSQTSYLNQRYRLTLFSTQEVVGGSTVPEPATWAMMLAGFGLVGSAVRRRRAISRANCAT